MSLTTSSAHHMRAWRLKNNPYFIKPDIALLLNVIATLKEICGKQLFERFNTAF